MSPKKEFVVLAMQEGSNFSELCRRYGVSRPTGYKWLGRFVRQGEDGLMEKSRRPHSSPWKVDAAIEKLILEMRDERPTWGARKIKRHLENQNVTGLPCPSTITEILRRNDRLNVDQVAKKWKRFESDAPMGLVQMDFKCYFQTAVGACHPLTVLDDHSRYLLGLAACPNERCGTVKARLTEVFRRYGLPMAIITDNGSPWVAPGTPESITELGAWLIRLGIEMKRSGAYHPQTMGKIERLHRTLKAEVIQARRFRSLSDCQRDFDEWREDYNLRRPHEAIGMMTPSDRFQISEAAFPEILPEIEYSPGDEVRKVQQGGWFHFRGVEYHVSKALKGQPIAVRAAGDGVYDVYFVRQKISYINLRDAP
jgi:transposase InsO family protein